MKTKRVLEQHPNPELRKVIIKNMKSKAELKMDIALNQMLKKLPGGENLYIANNGHIREKTPQQKAYQNSFQTRVPHRPPQSLRAGFSMPQYSMPPPNYHAPQPAQTRDYTPLPPPAAVYQSSLYPPTVSHQNFAFHPSGPNQFTTHPTGLYQGVNSAGQSLIPTDPIMAPLIQLTPNNISTLPASTPQTIPVESLAMTATDETNLPRLAQPPQQHAQTDQCHPVAGDTVQDRDRHVRTPFPDLQVRRHRAVGHGDLPIETIWNASLSDVIVRDKAGGLDKMRNFFE